MTSPKGQEGQAGDTGGLWGARQAEAVLGPPAWLCGLESAASQNLADVMGAVLICPGWRQPFWMGVAHDRSATGSGAGHIDPQCSAFWAVVGTCARSTTSSPSFLWPAA